jgi:hypothetical protein
VACAPASGTLNSTGKITCTVSNPQTTLTYTATASYQGNAVYAPAQADSPGVPG